MDVLAAMTEHAVAGDFQFSFGAGFMAIIATKILMRSVYPEVRLPVMVKQPVFPGIRVMACLTVGAEACFMYIIASVT